MLKLTLYFLDHTEEKPSSYTLKADSYSVDVKGKQLYTFHAEYDKKHKVLVETKKTVSLTDTMVLEAHILGGKEKRVYRIQRKRTPENTINFSI